MASRAAQLSELLGTAELTTLLRAAWLHDLGYAPALAQFGFHLLHGAGFLSGRGEDPTVCQLVAHHSGALVEAEVHGHATALAVEFSSPDPRLLEMLTWVDMTTGPDGGA